ncbi:MAG: histidine kinase [Bacteroidales bacterium]|nr:histidine kinase [Bacteroidales bacterium]
MANTKKIVANNKDSKLLRIFDIVFCIVLLPMTVLVFPVERWLYDYPLFVILFVVWIYVVYFVNRIFTVPLVLRSARGRWIAAMILVGSVAVTYSITCFEIENPYYYLIQPLSHRILPLLRKHQQAVWILFIAVEAFSFFVGMMGELQKQQQRQSAIELEHQRAELALYRAQINPHFLFNTLNMLYGMVVTRSDKAEEAFMSFMELMRYTYTHAAQDRVSLAAEVDFLEQYVQLQRFRVGSNTEVRFEHDIADVEQDLQVAPMLLITFVENAFKYGVSAHEPSHITLSLTARDGVLRFVVDNTIVSRGSDKGIGIDNCRRRLAMLYPDSHTLTISNDDINFHVELEIKL